VLLGKAEDLFDFFENEQKNRPPVIILTGEIGEGKTTFAKQLTAELAINGIPTAGFLAAGVQENGKRTGFDLEEIGSGVVTELASVVPHDGWIRAGHYYLDPEAIRKGKEILDPVYLQDKKVVIIDEVGPMELNREGWSDSLDLLCRQPALIQVWVVRKSIVKQVVRTWNTGDAFVFDCSTDQPGDVVMQIMNIL